MDKEILLFKILKFLNEKKYEDLKKLCQTAHPVDIADIIQEFEPAKSLEVLKILDPKFQAEVFTNIEEDLQIDITSIITIKELAQLITHMHHDDGVDLLKIIPEEKSENVLKAVAYAEREEIRRLLAYEEETAGSIMNSEYVTLSRDLNVKEAINEVRRQAPSKETIYYAYVVDKDRRLIGFVSLADLITAPSNKFVSDIMDEDILYARVNDDQEEVADMIAKYGLIAIPVVNGDNQIVGIVTYDDAIDVINQENTEDMEKFMAITGDHEPGSYLRTTVWEHFKRRIGWVAVLAIVGLFAGTVISNYEDSLQVLVVLAFFMPMIAATGGNVGSQSANVVIRALALKDLTIFDFPRILIKEFGISLLLAVLIGFVTFINAVIIMNTVEIPEGFNFLIIAMTVGFALSLQVISSTLIGAFLPLAATKLKFDPAVAASPAITTTVDITGLLIYFSIAKAILKV